MALHHRRGGFADRAVAQNLTVQPSEFADARSLLERAVLRADTTAGASSIDDMCQGGQVFTVHDSTGRKVAAYVLAARDHAAARVCWVMAAGGGLDGVDLTGEVLATVEAQARSMRADQVAITTNRRGLIRKMRARGFVQTGVTLRKNIKWT